ncbi:MAG: alginate lyase family protein [Candidatus Binatia bacterium]
MALSRSRAQVRNGDSALRPALSKLQRDADRALKEAPLSVTRKQSLPPSGDSHDYMSIAPYWWPNPDTANGLPYVRRDGKVNPERDRTSDRQALDHLVQRVKTLSLAYYFTGKESYAEHAAKLLRIWFLDHATKMNPHLRYAQAIPGRNTGRGNGIIETHDLPELIDAAALLQASNGWTQTDHNRLRDWFGAYLDWLHESPEGQAEAKARNNHGTWYDVQVASFASFTGREHVTREILRQFSAKRLAQQIEPDGRQPGELTRTRAWQYSLFNLEGLFDAAALAGKVGIDLWKYETADKRSIRQALEWLQPFATGEKTWPYKEITAVEPQKLAPLLRRAANVYQEPRYEKVIANLPNLTGDERWRLLYPTDTN